MKGLRITRCSQLKVGVKWNRRSPGGHRRHNCKISFLWTGMLFHCSICITEVCIIDQLGSRWLDIDQVLLCFFYGHDKVAVHKNQKKKKNKASHPVSHLNQTSLVNKGCIIERAVYVFSVMTIFCSFLILHCQQHKKIIDIILSLL